MCVDCLYRIDPVVLYINLSVALAGLLVLAQRCRCILYLIGPVATGGFGGLIPLNKAPHAPKLKRETL